MPEQRCGFCGKVGQEEEFAHCTGCGAACCDNCPPACCDKMVSAALEGWQEGLAVE